MISINPPEQRCSEQEHKCSTHPSVHRGYTLLNILKPSLPPFPENYIKRTRNSIQHFANALGGKKKESFSNKKRYFSVREIIHCLLVWDENKKWVHSMISDKKRKQFHLKSNLRMKLQQSEGRRHLQTHDGSSLHSTLSLHIYLLYKWEGYLSRETAGKTKLCR